MSEPKRAAGQPQENAVRNGIFGFA